MMAILCGLAGGYLLREAYAEAKDARWLDAGVRTAIVLLLFVAALI